MVNEIFPGPDLLNTSLVQLATLAALSSVSTATIACPALDMVAGGTVVEVTDGDTIVLNNGRVVRMIGTQAPKLPLGRDGFDTWPMGPEAKAALEVMVLNKTVQLGYGGEKIDRYDRQLAHVFVDTPDGPTWAQHAMVAMGLARVYSFPDNRQCLDLLFAAEGRARLSGLGIWRDPYYSVRAADAPGDLLTKAGHYELVEGRILHAEHRGGRAYLNFGRIWKQDFTAVIEAPGLKLFKAAGVDPLVLEGAFVRIRGWVDDRDGPRIEITHPEQLEVLATR
ncbi:thermonuclease family protein [Devosia neptuniae]|jgi:micrococcal nuclease|uniref:thermonuclease family protein n=1 Tax=Devosia TaxID=46913 RepID=UPI0022B01FD9|nr:thermonuclease family protein [Devosia neptuniae]MCZ4347544.1 thermonuclease family protein [Devosia neptuniae]|tara:strand:+ start:42083 stop:42922 length:840 start_codon:yes stop_codon:yes gene_type:complete